MKGLTLVWWIAVVTLGGCKKQYEEPATGTAPATAVVAPTASDAAAAPVVPTDTALEAAMNETLAMARAIGAVATKHQQDCGALATALEELVTRNQPLFDQLAGFGADDATAAKVQAWMIAHASELDTALASARPALEGCRNDPRIKAAFERLTRPK